MYASNIRRYIDTFGQKNVFVMNLDFIEDEISSLCKFLDIDKLTIAIPHKKVNKNKVATNIISRFFQHNRYLFSIRCVGIKQFNHLF